MMNLKIDLEDSARSDFSSSKLDDVKQTIVDFEPPTARNRASQPDRKQIKVKKDVSKDRLEDLELSPTRVTKKRITLKRDI